MTGTNQNMNIPIFTNANNFINIWNPEDQEAYGIPFRVRLHWYDIMSRVKYQKIIFGKLQMMSEIFLEE